MRKSWACGRPDVSTGSIWFVSHILSPSKAFAEMSPSSIGPFFVQLCGQWSGGISLPIETFSRLSAVRVPPTEYKRLPFARMSDASEESWWGGWAGETCEVSLYLPPSCSPGLARGQVMCVCVPCVQKLMHPGGQSPSFPHAIKHGILPVQLCPVCHIRHRLVQTINEGRGTFYLDPINTVVSLRAQSLRG